MKTILPVALLTVILTGCGPTQEQREEKAMQEAEAILQEGVDEIFGQDETDEAQEEEIIINKTMDQTVELATISFKATGYEEKPAITSQFGGATAAKEGTKFVIVSAEVTNILKESFTFSPGMDLIDSQGRSFDQYDDTIGNIDNYLNVRELQPSITEKGVLVYEVPENALGFKLAAFKDGSNEVFHIKIEEK